MIREDVYAALTDELRPKSVKLVAVSKTKPAADIEALYQLGQRDFGENYVQEATDKAAQLPADIRWHFIGHLQSNKVKYIAPFVSLIHAVDSFKLLQEINKQAAKHDRIVDVLLQLHIAVEETKFGLDEKELIELLEYYTAQKEQLQNVRICGLMGMATNTEDEGQVKAEFQQMQAVFQNVQRMYFTQQTYFNTLSIGMSGDYKVAVDCGSNMVRIGSMLFGARG